MIKVKNIYKNFEDTKVLKNISIEMQAGKVNFIIGGSGSGKTVLMKILLGLIPPTSGQVFYNNKCFFSLTDKERKKMRAQYGMVFQASALFDSLNVLDNVMMPLNFHTPDKYKIKYHKVEEALEKVRLLHAVKKYPNELSGGMKKRVAIARAIVLNPAYFFCDEPNSGLDPQNSLIIDELIKELTLNHNMTTVVNSHDMNSVLTIGGTISILFHGALEWTGTLEELKKTTNPKILNFINAGQFKFIQTQIPH